MDNGENRGFKYYRELLIAAGGAILTVVFQMTYGEVVKPLVLTLAVMVLSLAARSIFAVPPAKEEEAEWAGSFGRNSVDELVEKINGILKVIRSKAKDETKFRLVTNYLEQVNEFEVVIPKLHEAYKKGVRLAQSGDSIHAELAELERKHAAAKDGARDVYAKALEEKRKVVGEMEDIQANTAEIESKLYYIYTILQKIETTIDSSDIDDKLTDEDVTELNMQLETFSESVKGIMKSMKI